MKALKYKQLTSRSVSREAVLIFNKLLEFDDYDGIKMWHNLYTPWCSESTIN